MEPMPIATVLDVPLTLRANDVTKHIISVDSRFRDSPGTSTSSDYFQTLPAPVRNVLRIRITSIEFPNNYYIFTAVRKNVSFQILYGNTLVPTAFPVVIENGNYSAMDMETTLNGIFAASGSPVTWLSVAFDEINGRFTFTSTGGNWFAINTAYGSWNRPFDYGLGWNLGFTRTLRKDATAVSSSSYTLQSDICSTFAGDSYFFLRLNDYGCVRHTLQVYDATGRTRLEADSFTALAKVVLHDPKNFMSHDDYASQHIKEYVFPNPIDLSRLHVQAVDNYGNVMGLCSTEWSFSIEVLEIKNLSLYNTVRDSLALQYI
jgi:hypothetical protein